jgi:hypothetical protein
MRFFVKGFRRRRPSRLQRPNRPGPRCKHVAISRFHWSFRCVRRCAGAGSQQGNQLLQHRTGDGAGQTLAAEFQRDTKPLESAATLAYINGIGQRLAAQIGGPPFTYTFAVVADDPTVLHEGAAFPGGFLFVPASLILAVKRRG